MSKNEMISLKKIANEAISFYAATADITQPWKGTQDAHGGYTRRGLTDRFWL